MNSKVTKRDVRKTLDTLQAKDASRRKTFLAALVVYVPIMLGATWLFSSVVSCGSCEPTFTPPPPVVYPVETSPSLLQQEWDEIYPGDAIPHPPRDYGYDPSRDYEVEYLNEQLNKHGVTAERVNPLNLEHQRRYRRHFLGDLNPRMEMTPWQTHKVHSSPSSGTLFDENCSFCEDLMLDILLDIGI